MSAADLSVKLPENCLTMLELMAKERNTSVTVVLIEVIQQAYMLNHQGTAFRSRLSAADLYAEEKALLNLQRPHSEPAPAGAEILRQAFERLFQTKLPQP